ncbi:MAG: hypothetical protein LBT07_01120 [Endomicrobium sp.]|jgi:hypothetical protein|nr:hypothetical protein [Endomicrobium sp.]
MKYLKQDYIKKVKPQSEKVKKTSIVESKDDENNILWKPTYKWYAKTAGIVLGVLVVVFFVLNIVLKPYMRDIDPDITPWLNKSNKSTAVQR